MLIKRCSVESINILSENDSKADDDKTKKVLKNAFRNVADEAVKKAAEEISATEKAIENLES